MATVTGITAAKAKSIEDRLIKSARISGGSLIFTRENNTEIVAGSVGKPIDNWPVGSIFMNTSATNPNTLLQGGTWQRWGQGRVPVSQDASQTEFATANQTGGAKTHALSTAQMPAHRHATTIASAGAHTHNARHSPEEGRRTTEVVVNVGSFSGTTKLKIQYQSYPWDLPAATTSTGSHTHTATSATMGSGQAHNNLQPYVVCYMWRRTA